MKKSLAKQQYVLMTVGKTHSGKSTFCKKLLPKLKNAVIVESDPISTLLNKHYRPVYLKGDLTPGLIISNKRRLHYRILKDILDQAIYHGYNVLLPTSSLIKKIRTRTIKRLRRSGLKVVMVHFDISDDTIKSRIHKAKRDKSMLTVSKDFYDLLNKQNKFKVEKPTSKEADYFFVIKKPQDYAKVAKEVSVIINSHEKAKV